MSKTIEQVSNELADLESLIAKAINNFIDQNPSEERTILIQRAINQRHVELTISIQKE
jgi:hypothetical protein